MQEIKNNLQVQIRADKKTNRTEVEAVNQKLLTAIKSLVKLNPNSN